MRADPPTGPPDSKRQVRFIPFGRYERLVQRADLVKTRAAHDPRTNDDVDLLHANPVPWRAADRAAHAAPIQKIFPTGQRLLERKEIQAAAEAQQTEVGMAVEETQELGHEPASAEVHVILPGRQQRPTRGGEARVRAPQLVRIVHVQPAQVPLPPRGGGGLLEVGAREVAAAVLHHDELEWLRPSAGPPAADGTPQHLLVIEGRNDNRKDGSVGRGTHRGPRA